MTQIFVLGLLGMRPMSGYDIQTTLQEIDVEQWGGVLVGSIYHALKKLEKDKYIEIFSIEQTGHRQKATYQITDKGKAYLHELIIKTLGDMPALYPSSFYASLTFLDKCLNDEIKRALEQQLGKLEEEKLKIERGLLQKKAVFGNDLPPLVKLTFDNMLSIIQQQIDFLKQIMEHI